MAPGSGLAREERGAGRPVLFIHGLTFDRHLLLETTEPVFAAPNALHARRVYIDLPGHGETAADASAASAEGLVATLARAYDELVGEEAGVVVGHSYGGYLALALAGCRKVHALVLVTPVVEPDVARRQPAPRRIIGPDDLRYSASGSERATFEEVAVLQTSAVIAAYQRLVQPASDRTDRAFLAEVRARYVYPAPIVSRLDESMPVSIVCGRDDHWCGYTDAQALLRALPSAELSVLPGCGQLLPIEQPERYLRFMEQALRRALD